MAKVTVDEKLTKEVEAQLPAAFQACQAEHESSGKLGAINWQNLGKNVVSSLPAVLAVLSKSGVLTGNLTPQAIAALVAELAVTLGGVAH